MAVSRMRSIRASPDARPAPSSRIRRPLASRVTEVGARPAIHDEPEDVGAAVVASDVELVAGAAELRAFHLGIEDGLGLAGRSGEDLPVRVHDGALPRVQPFAGGGQVLLLEGETVGDV